MIPDVILGARRRVARRHARWLAAPLVLFLVCGCSRALKWGKVHKYPKSDAGFAVSEAIGARVTVLPPDLFLQEVGGRVTLPGPEYLPESEDGLKSALEQALREAGVDVRVFEATDSVFLSHPDLHEQLYMLRTATGAVVRGAGEYEDMLDLDFGGNIDAVCDVTGADYVLFVQGTAWFTTPDSRGDNGGLEAVALFLFPGGGNAVYAGTTVSAFIVDAHRGKVVWYNRTQLDNADPRNRAAMLITSRSLLGPLFDVSDDPWKHRQDDSKHDIAEAR